MGPRPPRATDTATSGDQPGRDPPQSAARNLVSLGCTLAGAGLVCVYFGMPALGGGAIVAGAAVLAWRWLSRSRQPPA
jgi:hypothetical protein